MHFIDMNKSKHKTIGKWTFNIFNWIWIVMFGQLIGKINANIDKISVKLITYIWFISVVFIVK